MLRWKNYKQFWNPPDLDHRFVRNLCFCVIALMAVIQFSGCRNSDQSPASESGPEKQNTAEGLPQTDQTQSDSVNGDRAQTSAAPTDTSKSLDLLPDAKVVETSQKISAADWARIQELNQLETLILDGGGVNPQEIAELTSLEKLEHVRIRNCAVDDAGIKHLSKIKSLRIVNFPQASFSDHALELLTRLPDLQLLRFSSPMVTDLGIAKLAKSKSLRAIHLIRVPITDEAVDSLCSIKTLESLYLDGSKLSDNGFRTILEKRPDLHLHVDQVHLDFDPNRHEHAPEKE